MTANAETTYDHRELLLSLAGQFGFTLVLAVILLRDAMSSADPGSYGWALVAALGVCSVIVIMRDELRIRAFRRALCERAPGLLEHYGLGLRGSIMRVDRLRALSKALRDPAVLSDPVLAGDAMRFRSVAQAHWWGWWARTVVFVVAIGYLIVLLAN